MNRWSSPPWVNFESVLVRLEKGVTGPIDSTLKPASSNIWANVPGVNQRRCVRSKTPLSARGKRPEISSRRTRQWATLGELANAMPPGRTWFARRFSVSRGSRRCSRTSDRMIASKLATGQLKFICSTSPTRTSDNLFAARLAGSGISSMPTYSPARPDLSAISPVSPEPHPTSRMRACLSAGSCAMKSTRAPT